MWGATTFLPRARCVRIFQSTLPVWGATNSPKKQNIERRISIHAPRVGSDLQRLEEVRQSVISIHAPRVGSDEPHALPIRIHVISIHAPRVGSDDMRRRYSFTGTHFNPRSPCGERLEREERGARAPNFNPRSPCGERQSQWELLVGWYIFQSTLPVWGATVSGQCRSFSASISIHAPRVGSDFDDSSDVFVYLISIHAPRVGSDTRQEKRRKR